ncbi:hypothetical protein FRB97_005396, partial [Tulasnella sp. 331]
DWERFSRYVGYIRSIHYDQADPLRGQWGVLSGRALADMFLHRPTSGGAILPNLATVHWTVEDANTLIQILPFLVPTVKNLQIHCTGSAEETCIKVLKVLAPRNILLTDLRIALRTHTQMFLEALPNVLTHQTQLIRVDLPCYSASRHVVTTLARLPCLEEYMLGSFEEYHTPLQIGTDFDWEQGAFTSLKKLALDTSLASVARVMSKAPQPRLDCLTLNIRDFVEHTHLRNLCSALSASQSTLTELNLVFYSETTDRDPSQTIPFYRLRPLLQCTALRVFRIHSDLVIDYDDEDIASMASVWPGLEELALCADPVSDVGLTVGQPLRSVGSFTQSFRALRELSLYLNRLDTDTESEVPVNTSQPRLSVLNFGTSPVLTQDTGSHILHQVVYVAAFLEPRAKLKSERSLGHKRFLQTSTTAEAEYSCRETFWSSFAKDVDIVLSGSRHLTRQITALLRQNCTLLKELRSAKRQSSCELDHSVH